MAVEFTLALIKSHATKWDGPPIVSLVLQRLLSKGLMIRALRWERLTSSMITALYVDHADRPYYSQLHASVAGEIVAMVLSGENAIARWRNLLGPTDPAKGEPGQLRRDFGDREVVANNVAHGSDSQQTARREIELFFPGFFRRDALQPSAGSPVPPI